MTSTQEVLQLVAAERQRQQDKWGEQNHPNVAAPILALNDAAAAAASFYGIPTAASARACTDVRGHGEVTWADILIEEVAEAIQSAALYEFHRADTGIDDAGCRQLVTDELVQVAAVAVQWAEKLGGAG